MEFDFELVEVPVAFLGQPIERKTEHSLLLVRQVSTLASPANLAASARAKPSMMRPIFVDEYGCTEAKRVDRSDDLANMDGIELAQCAHGRL